jgi:hypothetical protein
MAKQTLYGYVQGTDLGGVVETVEARLDALVAGRTWISKDVWVVNQQLPPEPGAKPGTTPDWDLGVNLALTPARTRPPAWIEDVVAIANAFAALHRETGRTFVIGIHDDKTDATRDLFFVDGEQPDLEKLKTALAAAK